MSVDFSQIVKQAYQGAEDFQVKDSQVCEHIKKVKAAVSIILKNYTRYSAQFFEQKSREWKTELTEAQNKLANRTCIDASNVFYLSDGVAHAMKDLNKSVFTTEEREWLAKEAASILAYLEEVQADYIDFLKGFDQEAVDAKVQVFKDGIEKLKSWIPEVPVKSFTKKEAPTPAELESSDLVALSPRLQSLEENQERLMTLKRSAEEMCAQLEAWKQAVESGQPFEGESPSSDVFQALVQKVEALSFRAVVIPEGLLEKVSLCSRVAGRALQRVAETSERHSSWLQDRQNDILDMLTTHQQWQNLSGHEHLPSPSGFIKDLNPDSSMRAQLEAVSWLHGRSEAQLEVLERSLTVLSQPEQTEFKALLDDSADASDFMKKLTDFYEKKLSALRSKLSTKEKQLQDLENQTDGEDIAKLIEAKQQLEVEIAELTSAVELHEVNFENALKAVQTLSKEQASLEEENARLEAQVERLGKLYEHKLKQNKSLRNVVKNLHNELDSSFTKYIALAREYKQLLEELENPKEQEPNKLL